MEEHKEWYSLSTEEVEKELSVDVSKGLTQD